jgi:photosystem II stability/assembly factor-like uncharacterized protein
MILTLRNRPMLARKHFCSILAVLGLILLGLFVDTTPTEAQWQHLASFPGGVSAVYFMKGDCSARVGFVGTNGWSIQKTTDGGLSWTQVKSLSVPDFYVATFEFKDTLTGWCTIANQQAMRTGEAIWKTTDGGNTWFSLNVSGVFASVYYQQYTHRLFVSNWALKNGSDLVSTDEGTTWQPLNEPASTSNVSFQHNGFVFATPTNGILSAVRGSDYLVTNDGGITWSAFAGLFNLDSSDEECYQPFVIPCTTSYLLMEESPMHFKRSDDGGQSWQTLAILPPNPYFTGTTVGDATHLFIQSIQHVEESIDGGVTWNAIGGPGNEYDQRMAAMGGYLYAGDILGGFFRYQYGLPNKSSAQLSVSPDTLFFASSPCSNSNQPIHLSAVMTCTECSDSMRLASVQFSGSNFFSTVSQVDPTRGVTQDDSIIIQHRPAASAFDTAVATLNFTQYGQTVQRQVVLVGQSVPRSTVRVGLVSSGSSLNVQAHAGQAMQVFVTLEDPVQASAGLTALQCSLPYDPRTITKVLAKGLNGWTISNETDQPNNIILNMTCAPHNSQAGEQVVEVTFQPDVAAVQSSYISLSGVRFNPSDPNFENCTLTSNPQPDTVLVQIANDCGDSTLRSLMGGMPLVKILSIQPDPVAPGGSQRLTVRMQLARPAVINASVQDMTGRTIVGPIQWSLAAGITASSLDISSLAEGAYMLTMESEGTRMTRKIVVQSH